MADARNNLAVPLSLPLALSSRPDEYSIRVFVNTRALLYRSGVIIIARPGKELFTRLALGVGFPVNKVTRVV